MNINGRTVTVADIMAMVERQRAQPTKIANGMVVTLDSNVVTFAKPAGYDFRTHVRKLETVSATVFPSMVEAKMVFNRLH